MSARRRQWDGPPAGQHQRELRSARAPRLSPGAHGSQPLGAPRTSGARGSRQASNRPPASEEQALKRVKADREAAESRQYQQGGGSPARSAAQPLAAPFRPSQATRCKMASLLGIVSIF